MSYNKKTTKKTFSKAFFALFIFVALLGVKTPVYATSDTTCPFVASGDNYVVQFSQKVIFSNKGAGNAYVDATANIPAGTYDITLVGYDDHLSHGGQGQTNERYHLILINNGQHVFTTNSLQDIPENVNTSTTLVNSGAVLSQAVTSIRAQHSGYPNTGNYQSIIPICAQFKKINTNPALQLTCSVSPTTVYINNSVTYTAQATGGSGTYTYAWSGAKTGTGQTLTTSFGSVGTYIETVTVTDSSNVTKTASCSNVVVEEPVVVNNLNGSCSASPSNGYVNQNVVWTAQATGGNGNYSYSWSGTDNLQGNSSSVNRTYTYAGLKYGYVTISSNGQSITRNCTVNVNPTYIYEPPVYYPPIYYPPQNQPIYVTCYANPQTASVNQNVVWTAQATGGNGNYSYSWSGTDGLSYGNASAIQKVYTVGGQKTAQVTVYSNGISNTATCSAFVQQIQTSVPTIIRQPTTGTPISGVFLSEVPATGISNSVKVTLFTFGILAWSLGITYIINQKKKRRTYAGISLAEKAIAFKKANLLRKNQ